MSRSLLCGGAAAIAVAWPCFIAHAQQTLPDLIVTLPETGGQTGPHASKTTAGPVVGYKALTGKSATKTDTPIEKIPQSIVVVPRTVIDDQNSVSTTEAVRNVSSVQGTSTLETPSFDGTFIRGFPGEQWLDGLTNYYNIGDRDSLANVERIEVLKGPNAILYGGGSGAPLGGVINVVSKLPQDRAFGEVGATFGSYGLLQPFFDLNQPLTKDGAALFRLTGEYTKANSFIDGLDKDSYNLNPTLTLTNTSDTTLTLQGRISNWTQQDYQGLPATGTLTGPFRLNPNMFVGPSDLPRSTSKVDSLTIKLDHTFNSVWSMSAQARLAYSEWNQVAQNFYGADGFAGNAPVLAPSTWGLANLVLSQHTQETSVNGDAVAKFSVGPTENKFLIGADYARLSDAGVMLIDPNDYVTLPPVDLTAPAYPPFVAPANVPGNVVVGGANTYVSSGASAQLQTDIWDRVHLLGGLRLASLNIAFNSITPPGSAVTDATRVLPRIGAVVDIVKGFSLFADYSEGMKANPWLFYVGAPKPEFSKQVEAGVKFDLGFGLSGSAAVFQIDRTGAPVFTGIADEAIGVQRSRGVDFDALWQPNASWQIIANYAHVEARQINAIPGVAAAGNVLNIVPPDSGRLWANYKFDGAWRGWSAGAGVYAASGAYVDPANLYKTAGFATVDAKIAYEHKHFSASIDVKNLLGARYFVPFNYYGGRVAPGDARTLLGRVAVKF